MTDGFIPIKPAPRCPKCGRASGFSGRRCSNCRYETGDQLDGAQKLPIAKSRRPAAYRAPRDPEDVAQRLYAWATECSKGQNRQLVFDILQDITERFSNTQEAAKARYILERCDDFKPRKSIVDITASQQPTSQLGVETEQERINRIMWERVEEYYLNKQRNVDLDLEPEETELTGEIMAAMAMVEILEERSNSDDPNVRLQPLDEEFVKAFCNV